MILGNLVEENKDKLAGWFETPKDYGVWVLAVETILICKSSGYVGYEFAWTDDWYQLD